MSETNTATTDAKPAAVVAPVGPDYVSMVKQTFHFKKAADTKGADEAGKEVVLAVGTKHPTIEVYLPVPKPSRLVEILSDTTKFAKEAELLMSAVRDVIYGAARGQINDFRERDPSATVSQAVLNYDALDWTAIANVPPAQRGAYVPSDEETKAFLASYLEVMPAATNKSIEQIKYHVTLLGEGLKKQKAQKNMLEFFAGMLQVYLASAGEDAVEEHIQVIDFLTTRITRWLSASEQITMDML